MLDSLTIKYVWTIESLLAGLSITFAFVLNSSCDGSYLLLACICNLVYLVEHIYHGGKFKKSQCAFYVIRIPVRNLEGEFLVILSGVGSRLSFGIPYCLLIIGICFLKQCQDPLGMRHCSGFWNLWQRLFFAVSSEWGGG